MNKSSRIRNVLLISSFLIFIIVVVGGYTRLQKAGLSITEWKPISGVVPPISQEDWEVEFEKYKKIAQYRLVHPNITLSDFKRIYLIEYFHRLFARAVGLFVFLSFIWLVFVKEIKSFWFLYFIVLFLLFGLQGLLGWLMVRTGVVNEIPFVDPVFLAIHKLFAMLVFSYVFFGAFLADDGSVFRRFDNSKKIKNLAFLGIILFLVQVFFGALLAGYKGALLAPTYPHINGEMIPYYVFSSLPVFSNFFHRHFPWVILVILLLLLRYSKFAFWGILIWVIQFLLGLFTLIHSRAGEIPQGLALLHQANGWVMFSFFLYMLYSTFIYRPYEKIKIISERKFKIISVNR